MAAGSARLPRGVIGSTRGFGPLGSWFESRRGSHSTRSAGAPLAHGLRPARTSQRDTTNGPEQGPARPASKGHRQGGKLVAAWFYILRLRSGCLYLGSTTDLERRLAEHRTSKGGRTTALDPPAELAFLEEFSTFADARCREAQIKRWSRAKKEALVAGDRTGLRQLAISRDHKHPTSTCRPQDRCT